MKQKLQGPGMNLLRFLTHTKQRNGIFRRAPAKPMEEGVMNRLARQLHPHGQRFRIEEVRLESPDTKSYRLKALHADVPAFFRAGQYLSFSLKIDGSTLRRPFSISTPPDRSLLGELEITIRKTDPGFASAHIYDTWKEGSIVESSGPAGEFCFSPLRDKNTLIFLGGGSGITPFRSLIPDILEHHPDRKILLFHGAVESEQFLFLEEFRQLTSAHPDAFRYIPVCSGEDSSWQGVRGFIDSPLMEGELSTFLPEEKQTQCSFFLCGPPAMESHLRPQLEKLGLPRKQFRRENFAADQLDKGEQRIHSLTVRIHPDEYRIDARSDESLLVALERAGLSPPSLCRSGTCGWCRARLISGKTERAPGESGLRLADEKFSHVHPCTEYPRSDLELSIPHEPAPSGEER